MFKAIFRLKVLMCCTVTMLMEKKMKTFKDGVIGYLMSKCRYCV